MTQGRDGSLVWWTARAGTLQMVVQHMALGGLSFCRLALDPALGAPRVALPTPNANDVQVVDVTSGAAVQKFVLPPDSAPAGMCLALAYLNERQLLAGHEDGSVVLWDLAAPAIPISRFRLHSEPVLALACASDMVLTGGADEQ